MKKYLKLRKHTFKNIHKFFESVTDKPVFNEGLVFSDKLFHVNSKTRVSNTRESPRGRLMPSPRATIKLRMPHPGTDNLSKCPAVARGGGGGWAPLELIDALTYVIAFSTAILISCHAKASKFNLALPRDEKPYQTENLWKGKSSAVLITN